MRQRRRQRGNQDGWRQRRPLDGAQWQAGGNLVQQGRAETLPGSTQQASPGGLAHPARALFRLPGRPSAGVLAGFARCGRAAGCCLGLRPIAGGRFPSASVPSPLQHSALLVPRKLLHHNGPAGTKFGWNGWGRKVEATAQAIVAIILMCSLPVASARFVAASLRQRWVPGCATVGASE